MEAAWCEWCSQLNSSSCKGNDDKVSRPNPVPSRKDAMLEFARLNRGNELHVFSGFKPWVQAFAAVVCLYLVGVGSNLFLWCTRL